MSEPAPSPPPSRLPPLPALALFALLGITGAACAVALYQGWVSPELIQSLARRSGPGGMAAYVGAVVLLELLWMPRAWGIIAGGVLFGPLAGIALSIAADLTSASIGYFVARGTARAWVKSLVERRPRARRLVEILTEERGVFVIALLRICPIAHFTLCHYVAGVAGVRPAPYFLGTLLGLLPAAVLYSFFGDALLRPGSTKFIVMAALLGITVVLSLVVGRRLLRAPPSAPHADQGSSAK